MGPKRGAENRIDAGPHQANHGIVAKRATWAQLQAARKRALGQAKVRPTYRRIALRLRASMLSQIPERKLPNGTILPTRVHRGDCEGSTHAQTKFPEARIWGVGLGRQFRESPTTQPCGSAKPTALFVPDMRPTSCARCFR